MRSVDQATVVRARARIFDAAEVCAPGSGSAVMPQALDSKSRCGASRGARLAQARLTAQDPRTAGGLAVRRHSRWGEVDLARFRGLVENLLDRAYPSARVSVMFNDLLQDARIEIGQDDGHVRIVRRLIERASRESRRRTTW